MCINKQINKKLTTEELTIVRAWDLGLGEIWDSGQWQFFYYVRITTELKTLGEACSLHILA